MKRGRGDQLTGGSGDVNPQEFVVRATQTAADTTAQSQLPLPIPRFPTQPGKNLVIEALWVDYFHVNANFPGGAATSHTVAQISTNSTVPASVIAALIDPKVIDSWFKSEVVATGVGFGEAFSYYHSDLTDQAGHGVLIATDNLFANVVSSNTGVANDVVMRIGYRWKTVTLTEYIGIVQSQQ